MIEHWWKVRKDGREEMIEWDSETKSLIAPTVVSLAAYDSVDSDAVVYVTPVGPRVLADLDESVAAWATVSDAIQRSGYELLDGSPAPMEPEPELAEDNPANE